MDPRSIVSDLSKNNLPSVYICRKINATLRAKTIVSCSVTLHFYVVLMLSSNDGISEVSIAPWGDKTDQAILLTLKKQPFAWMRQLTPLTLLHRSIVHKRLKHSLEFTVQDFRWVAHCLSKWKNDRRADISQSILRTLRKHRARAWHGMAWHDMTSWPLKSHDFILTQSMSPSDYDRGKEPIEGRPNGSFCRLNIVWNLKWFHEVNVLAKGAKIKVAHNTFHILKTLSKLHAG
jgi:hypothetical protein